MFMFQLMIKLIIRISPQPVAEIAFNMDESLRLGNRHIFLLVQSLKLECPTAPVIHLHLPELSTTYLPM